MATEFTFDKIPDQTGKLFIVTGASSGLGRVTALELARKNAHVILATRNEEKTKPVLEAIKKETGNSNVEFMKVDLLSLRSVDDFSNQVLKKHKKLDGLILNAGIMFPPFELSKDGIESQFATNHLAHFHMTQKLLPIIEAAPKARIVSLSSMGHQMAPREGVMFDKLNDEKSYSPYYGYGQSKLCNILFTKELARRLEERGVKHVYANAVHPGVIKTELGRYMEQSILMKPAAGLMWLFGMYIDENKGSSTSLYCATSPEIEEKNYKGEYFVPIAKLAQPSAQGKDMNLAKKLWEFSEKLVAEKLA